MMRWEPPRPICRAVYCVVHQLAAASAIALTATRYFDVPDMRRLGAVLIASNHQSYLDPFLVGAPLQRPIHFLARETLFRVPGFGQLIRAVGAHPVARSVVGPSALRTAIHILGNGEPLLMFPEGTRTRDGSLGEFRRGVASLAVRCGVPILPVCIEGAFRCWPRARLLPMPAHVAVAYGEPLESEGANSRALIGALTARISQMQRFLRKWLSQKE